MMLQQEVGGDGGERTESVYQLPSTLGWEPEGQQEQEIKKNWADGEQESGGAQL